MALILTQKLKRNGWPEDEPPAMMEESLLVYSTGIIDNENETIHSFEWRLDGLIVKRGAHVRLKKNVAADAIAAALGG